VISGLHSLGDSALSTAVSALTVVAVMFVIGLLGLEPGISVLFLGLTMAASLADHLRRSNRDARSSISA
jgi:hypothetical protein